MAGENGQASELVMVPFGPAPDDIVTLAVAGRILTMLLERDEVLFSVLLAEAMTTVRLAKVRARSQPGDHQAAAEAGADSG